jgi:RNA recognition motif-containing protein
MTECISQSNYFIGRVIDPRSWDEQSDDSDDSDDEPLTKPTKPVPPVTKPTKPVEPTQPKTWAKLPEIESNVEPNLDKVEHKVDFVDPNPNKICTLMVKNVPRDSNNLNQDLRLLFSKYGPIKDIYIPINRDGKYAGTIKGFAKLQFRKYQHADIAVTASLYIRNNKLAIEYANQDK